MKRDSIFYYCWILCFHSILISIGAFAPCKKLDSRPYKTVTGNDSIVRQPIKTSLSTTIYSSRRYQDSLVAGIAEIGIGFSLGVLWSEYSIIMTGCGPLNFSDTLERICYQGVIVLSGLLVFNRIVTGGKGLDDSSVDFFGPLEDFTLIQVRAAEYASLLAVFGAFVALALQESRGINLEGLSGIDVAMCRAMRDL